jgi:hypothetical protein
LNKLLNAQTQTKVLLLKAESEWLLTIEKLELFDANQEIKK